MQAEKRLTVYKDGEPVKKFYVKQEDTLSDIEKYVSDRYPGYYFKIYNDNTLLEPYDYDAITDGKIVLTPLTKLSLQKNTDEYIADMLDEDRDLLNLCIAAPDLAICRNDDFWKNRFLKKWGPIEKSPNKSWKTLYLQLIYHMDKEEEWDYRMELAARGGHRDLVDYFISKGADFWDFGMRGAAFGGHRDLVDYFISLGADEWGKGMYGAALGGHRDLIDYFISKGVKRWDWKSGMLGAARGGHRDLIDYFISLGANDLNWGMVGAARGGHRDLVDYFISKGGKDYRYDWNLGMLGAVEGGHRDLVEYFISRGANDWNRGMHYAAQEGDRDLIDYFIRRGANDWKLGMAGAEDGGQQDLVEFFRQKMKQ